ncbi:MAG: hypothetical protein O2936_14660 [Proteobacteria bacterium]|nr:hypothetical protein [Pseudomonadota bacterium]
MTLLLLIAVRYWWGELPRFGGSLTSQWIAFARDQTSGIPGYLLAVVAPAIAVGWLSAATEGVFMGLVTLVIHIAVLLVSVRAPSTEQVFDELLMSARQKDADNVILAARQSAQFKNFLSELHQGFLVYILWYLLLGPGGVVFCALQKQFEADKGESAELAVEGPIEWFYQVFPWLEGLSVRITVLLLAIVGRFSDGWPFFVGSLKDWSIQSGDLLIAAFSNFLPQSADSETEPRRDAQTAWVEAIEALVGRLFFAWMGFAALIAVLS